MERWPIPCILADESRRDAGKNKLRAVFPQLNGETPAGGSGCYTRQFRKLIMSEMDTLWYRRSLRMFQVKTINRPGLFCCWGVWIIRISSRPGKQYSFCDTWRKYRKFSKFYQRGRENQSSINRMIARYSWLSFLSVGLFPGRGKRLLHGNFWKFYKSFSKWGMKTNKHEAYDRLIIAGRSSCLLSYSPAGGSGYILHDRVGVVAEVGKVMQGR